MNGNAPSLIGQVLADIVRDSLEVIVEADFFWSEKLEASHSVAVLLGQVDEVFAILLLGVGVVYNHTVAFHNLLFCRLVAFLLGLQGVSVHSLVLTHIVLPKC